MGFTEVIIILLFTIVVSNIVDSAFPTIPLPLILIVFGAALSLSPLGYGLKLEPDIFMALLVAPLLFRESEESDFRALWSARKQVVLMAFLLVFITVFAVGFSVHAIVPSVPLAACFALGAILGPTDAIAVSSMSSRVDIDDGIKTILKGEGLINDASGVIAFRFAVAAMLTGYFSFWHAAGDFLLVSVGGFVAGLIIVQLKLSVIERLKRLDIRSNSAFMILEVLTPFICYLVAETVGVSGVIAAVIAGIRQSLHVERADRYQAEFGIFKKSIWEMLQAAFNSIVFLLLGLQLPGIVTDVYQLPGIRLTHAFLIGLFATVLVLAVRFVSSLVFSGTVLSDAAGAEISRAGDIPECGPKDEDCSRLSKLRKSAAVMKHSLILTLSGVKGTVSLATAFSLPWYFSNSEGFPQRPFLLLVTATVIILSLLIAVVVLPFIAKRRDEGARENEKRIEVLDEVLGELRSDSEAYSSAVVLNVTMRIKELAREDMKMKERRELRNLRRRAYEIECGLIRKRHEAGEMTDNEYEIYSRILAVMHRLISKPFFGGMGMRGVFFRGMDLADRETQKRRGPKIFGRRDKLIAELAEAMEPVKCTFWDNTSIIIEELRAQSGEGSSEIVSEVIAERIDMGNRIVSGIFGGSAGADFHEDYDRELLKCFALERTIIGRFEAVGKLSVDEADAMRVEVNMLETYIIEDKRHANIMRLLMGRRKNSRKG
ncbi:MAG: sodium:proton antiporter [Clostridiales Family XIII bacterium]|jgi:CPA1 family monovalent cation:H+ antiporter|nr:sodium:proton antiporter [Clostridiales Family XIII bacterium]